MTVEELIARLQECDPKALCVVLDYDNNVAQNVVVLEEGYLRKDKAWWGECEQFVKASGEPEYKWKGKKAVHFGC